jgi:hypothetical protein
MLKALINSTHTEHGPPSPCAKKEQEENERERERERERESALLEQTQRHQ